MGIFTCFDLEWLMSKDKKKNKKKQRVQEDKRKYWKQTMKLHFVNEFCLSCLAKNILFKY